MLNCAVYIYFGSEDTSAVLNKRVSIYRTNTVSDLERLKEVPYYEYFEKYQPNPYCVQTVSKVLDKLLAIENRKKQISGSGI